MTTAICPQHSVHGAGWDFGQKSATEKKTFYLWVHFKHSDPFVNWTIVPNRMKATLYPLSKKIKCIRGESFVWVVLCTLNYVKPGTRTVGIFLSLRLRFTQSSDVYLGWIIPVTAWSTSMPCHQCPSMFAYNRAQTSLFWTLITPTHPERWESAGRSCHW